MTSVLQTQTTATLTPHVLILQALLHVHAMRDLAAMALLAVV